MGDDAQESLDSGDGTIGLLERISDEARQHGIGAKLESAERALEGETRRRAALDPSSEPQKSTFFVSGVLEPPLPLAPDSPALDSGPREAFLVVYSGSNRGWEFTLRRERTIVGRDRDADVRLCDDSVSRRHAAIIKSSGRYYLRDLESSNGTYFNGVLKGAEQPLADGDRFRIGDSDFVFRLRAVRQDARASDSEERT